MSSGPTTTSSSTTVSSTRPDILDGGGGLEAVSSGSVGDSRGSVSVPTDLTVTSDADTADFSRPRPRRPHTEVPNDRAELLRTVELLRLQLATREEQLTSTRVQHRSALARHTEDRDAQLADAAAHADRLQREAVSSRRELAEVQERVARELAALTSKCAALQANMNRLSVTQEEARASLRQLEVGRAQYERLRALPEQQLNLREYATLRLHEAVWPLRVRASELEAEKQQLQQQLNGAIGELRTSQRQGTVSASQTSDLREELEGLKGQMDRLNDQLREEDFRVQNYTRIKQERDSFEEQLLTTRTKLDENTRELQVAKNEGATLSARLDTAKSQARRADNECAQAKEELGELRKKFLRAASDVEKGNTLLAAERNRLADTHNKYLQTQSELTGLRENLKDVESERSFLREKLEDVSGNRGQLQHRVDELRDKCQSLQTELEKYKLKGDRCIAECEAELSELRTNLLTSTKQQNEMSDENVLLRRELNELRLDQQRMKLRNYNEISALKTDLNNASSSLKAYEELEKEYEASLRAISSQTSKHASDTQMKLFPGLCLKSNKVLQQTVKLSSKVLKLERDNDHAKSTIQKLTTALGKLRNSLYAYKCAVSNIGEPARSLHRKHIDQEEEITTLHAALEACNKEREFLDRRNKKMINGTERLKASLQAYKAQADELKRIITDLNRVKDIVLKSLRLDPGAGQSSGGRGHQTTTSGRTLPSAITLSNEF